MKYFYNNITKEYCGTIEPLGENFSFTNLVPPHREENEFLYFDNNQWILKLIEKNNENEVSDYIKSINNKINFADYEIQLLNDVLEFEPDNEMAKSELTNFKKYRIELFKIKRSNDFPNLDIEIPEYIKS